MQTDTVIALAGCAVVCGGYALALSTKAGRKFTVRHTWVTVVLGVLIVLASIAFVDPNAALLALAFFVAGGLPMVVRSLWLDGLHQQSKINHLQSEISKLQDELDDELNHRDGA